MCDLHPFSSVANIYVGDHFKFSPLAMPPSSVKITFQEPVSIPFGFLTRRHLCCETTLSKPLKWSASPKARSTHSTDRSLLMSQLPVHHLLWLHLLTHSSPQSSPCTGATAQSTVCWKVEMTQMDDLWVFHFVQNISCRPICYVFSMSIMIERFYQHRKFSRPKLRKLRLPVLCSLQPHYLTILLYTIPLIAIEPLLTLHHHMIAPFKLSSLVFNVLHCHLKLLSLV